MPTQIRIDDDAWKRLNRIKKEMSEEGIDNPNYSDTIRYMDRVI